MPKRKILTNEEVEKEIERLNESEAVALARRKLRLEYRRRQYLYQLRDLEKKGKALIQAGITREILDRMYAATGDDLPSFTEIKSDEDERSI
jgi:hypothetical protein